MKMVNILACAGMVTGFFLILRLTPMEFTDGVFRHFLKSPDSIKAEIQKTQKRKMQETGFHAGNPAFFICRTFTNDLRIPDGDK